MKALTLLKCGHTRVTPQDTVGNERLVELLKTYTREKYYIKYSEIKHIY